MIRKLRFFQVYSPVPAEYRRNFRLLYSDIAWWGLLNGSVLVFLSIYVSRLGASTFQLGLLTASPAIMNLMFTFPSGSLLKRAPTGKATFISAIANRFFYLLLIPLPVLLPASTQIWVIILITLLMNIPGTMISIVFNAYFAEIVPVGFRGQVVGIRNALFALTTMVTALVVGVVLEKLPFATGYQVVFAIGVVGAAFSAISLAFIRAPEKPLPIRGHDPVVPEIREQIATAARAPLRAAVMQSLHLDVVKGVFGPVLLLIFLLQISVNLIGPVFPIYQVQTLKLTDITISQGSALYWVVNFVGSLQVQRFSSRWGFKRMTGYGFFVVAGTLVMFTFAYHNWIYLLQQSIGGFGWALINAGLINFILEQVPVDDRASHLAWYNLATNAALLLCGMLAPLIAGAVGAVVTLLTASFLRIVVGLLLAGRPQKSGGGGRRVILFPRARQ